jgi:hypothetical protein
MKHDTARAFVMCPHKQRVSHLRQKSHKCFDFDFEYGRKESALMMIQSAKHSMKKNIGVNQGDIRNQLFKAFKSGVLLHLLPRHPHQLPKESRFQLNGYPEAMRLVAAPFLLQPSIAHYLSERQCFQRRPSQ